MATDDDLREQVARVREELAALKQRQNDDRHAIQMLAPLVTGFAQLTERFDNLRSDFNTGMNQARGACKETHDALEAHIKESSEQKERTLWNRRNMLIALGGLILTFLTLLYTVLGHVL